jgi:hypothetical protein
MLYAALMRKSESAAPAKSATPTGGIRIGEPNDSFEQEAERVAEEVMTGGRAQWSLSAVSIGAPLRRKCDCGGSGECEECKEEKKLQRKANGLAATAFAPPIVDEVLRSPGQPLDAATRAFFEPRFGYNFSRVRVHTDLRAADSAHAVAARAYTAGHHIFFAAGRYAPGTNRGNRLLAHELTHVVQLGAAGGGSGQVIHRQPAPEEASKRSALEHAAGVAAGIQTPEEFRQLRCVIGEVCPQAKGGGALNEDDKGPANEKCRPRTGYGGPDVFPTPDQCAEMKPGTLQVVTPSRLKQLHSLLDEYTALVRANALRKDEEFGIDAAISEAEEKLGSLGGQPPSPDKAPPVVVAKEGGTVPTPAILAGGVAIPGSAGLFSAGVRLLSRVPQAIPFVVGLIVIGYITNDFLLRIEASDALEKLIGIMIRLFRGKVPQVKVSPEGEITQEEKPGEKPQPQGQPKPEETGPTIPISRQCRSDPCEHPLPISWPTQLPPPVGPRSLVRTTTADREWEGIERGKAQSDFQEEIRRARERLVPPPHPCFDDDAEPNAPYDAHHAHPLYLGGEDAPFNLCALRADRHQIGHPRLDDQSEHRDEYLECGVCSTRLSQHPPGQTYQIVGEK